LPVTIAAAATALSITDSQVLSGAGTVGQYVRGDGSLADFPATTGGGASVSYYLNGSVSQGTIGGVAYREFNRNPVFGAGTNISTSSNGYIANFITDAGDPNKLLIPAGNWNLETYFSASSGGGSPTFYVELYKYDGSTFTLIASNSGSPELIAFGTNLTPYFSTLAVPQTTLALTDRLALRYYVNTSGRTITLHTEDNNLCQVITTFTTGLTALNGLTTQVQFFAVGTSGTDFAISSATDTHTFNLPTASASNRGALSSADWTIFNNKENSITAGTTAQYYRGDKTFQTLNTSVVPELTNLYYTEARVNANANVAANTAARHNAVTLGTANGLSLSTQQLSLQLASGSQNGALSSTDWTTFNSKENAITAGTTAQYFRGDKTFQTLNTAAVPELTNLYYTEARVNANANVAANTAARHNAVTLGTANGLSLSTQQLSLGLASAGVTGALSGTDWSTFNSKQNALTNPITGTGTSGQIAFFNGTNTITSESGLTWDSANNRLAIGLLSSNVPLFVSNGDVNSVVGVFTGNNAARGLQMSTYNSAVDDSGVFINAQHSSGQISLATAGNQRIIISNGSIDLRNTTLAASSVYFDTTYQDALTVNSLGRVLINKTDDNGARLQVSGNASISSLAGTGTRMVVADANGLLSAVSNPVTGTGTTNYLPKFTGTSTIGNSLIFDNGTNVGINQAIPTRTLDILGASGIGTVLKLQGASGTTTYLQLAYNGATNAQSGYIGYNSSSQLQFFTNDTLALTIDSSRNLGLGVTPSAWGSSFKAFDILQQSSIAAENDAFNITLNAYYDTSWKYKATGKAQRYVQYDGNYYWFNAPSGTAGNAISFTQAMTLGSNSGLSIGTPSAAPSQGLLVNGVGTFNTDLNVGNGTTSVSLAINRGAAANGNGLRFQTAATNNWYIGSAATSTNTDLEIYNHNTATTNLRLSYSTGAATFSSSVTAGGLLSVNGDATLVGNFNYSSNGTYVRWQNNGTSFGDIGSAGSLVSGGATNDFAIHARSTFNMVFSTNFTERMRITTGGQLLVGDTSSPSTGFKIDSNGMINIRNGFGLVSRTSSTELWGLGDTDFNVIRAGVFGIATFTARDMMFATNNTERMRITSGGNVLIGTATNGASKLRISGLPTSAIGLSSGDVYNMAGVLMIA
jgi:hypothetical protein